MKSYNDMSDFQMDVLKEVGNIGAGNAATALSTLLNKSVDLKVPSALFVEFDEVADIVGGAESVVASIFLRVEGDISGNIFLFFSQESALNLVNQLLGEKASASLFTEMAFSALQEIGNIVAGSYLSSLADFTKLNMHSSIPNAVIDMAGAILSVGLAELGPFADYALLIDTSFIQGQVELQGHVVLIPSPESVATLFQALGVPME